MKATLHGHDNTTGVRRGQIAKDEKAHVLSSLFREWHGFDIKTEEYGDELKIAGNKKSKIMVKKRKKKGERLII